MVRAFSPAAIRTPNPALQAGLLWRAPLALKSPVISKRWYHITYEPDLV